MCISSERSCVTAIVLRDHYVEQPRAKTQRSPFAAERAWPAFRPLLSDRSPLGRPGKPRHPPALTPSSRTLKGPCQLLHRPFLALIVFLVMQVRRL